MKNYMKIMLLASITLCSLQTMSTNNSEEISQSNSKITAATAALNSLDEKIEEMERGNLSRSEIMAVKQALAFIDKETEEIEKGNRSNSEIIASAAALAFSDKVKVVKKANPAELLMQEIEDVEASERQLRRAGSFSKDDVDVDGIYSKKIEKLIAGGVDLTGKDGCFEMTLLHKASFYGMPKTAKTLIDNGFNPNDKDHYGQKALHHASWHHSSFETLQVLLAAGADVNDEDQNGEGPLFDLRGAVIEKAKALLARGANPTHPNKNGQTPLDRAKKKNNSELVALFENAQNAEYAKKSYACRLLGWFSKKK